jgi:hypothetical protein
MKTHGVTTIRVAFLGFLLVWLSGNVCAQQVSTGSNHCTIRIATGTNLYESTSDSMDASLNDALERFEFKIPSASLTSKDTADLFLLNRLATGNGFITITVALPDDQDGELDLSRFRGNRPLNLAGEIGIGKHQFENGVEFNGMLIGQDKNTMAFALTASLRERTLVPLNTGNEKIIEIQIAVKGDRIIRLTTN